MIFRLGNFCCESTFGPVLGFLRRMVVSPSFLVFFPFLIFPPPPPPRPPLLRAGPSFHFFLPPFLARRSGNDRTAALRLSGLLFSFLFVFSLYLDRLARSLAPLFFLLASSLPFSFLHADFQQGTPSQHVPGG